MPPASDLTRIQFHSLLLDIDIFDGEFSKRFPGISLTRFSNEVVISTKSNDEGIFDTNAGYGRKISV